MFVALGVSAQKMIQNTEQECSRKAVKVQNFFGVCRKCTYLMNVAFFQNYYSQFIKHLQYTFFIVLVIIDIFINIIK